MTTLLLAEVHGGKLNDSTAKALTAAAALGAPVHILVAGDAGEAAQAAAKLVGVEKVLTIAGDAFAHGLAEPLADLIVSLAPSYDAIVAPATSTGKNVLPRVAALLDVDYPLKLYLLYFLHTQTNRLRGVNQGAAQPNLNTTIIKGINVPVPPLAEQTRIVAEVERRLSVVEELETVVSANLQRATRFRQSILQRAFIGEL